MYILIHAHTYTQNYRYRLTNRFTTGELRTDRQVGWLTDRQTDRQTDRLTY